MFKRLKNRKGFLFGFVGLVPSIFMVFSALNIGYSAYITPEFRREKAVQMCEEAGSAQCEQTVAALSDEEVVEFIRDGNPKNDQYYEAVWEDSLVETRTSGGGLRQRILDAQN